MVPAGRRYLHVKGAPHDYDTLEKVAEVVDGEEDALPAPASKLNRKLWNAWLLAILATIVLIATASALWAAVPDLYRNVADEPARVQAIVATRASVIASLAGIAAIITIAINVRNSNSQARTASAQGRAAEAQGRAAEAQARAAEAAANSQKNFREDTGSHTGNLPSNGTGSSN